MSFNSRKLLFGSPYFTDPYWNNTSLLLHGDGIGATPNGQQNNTFLDSSTNNTITRNGTPTQGSFSPYALNGVAYSPTIHGGGAYFPGVNSNYLSVPSNAAFNFTSGTFTVECWIRLNSVVSGTFQQIVGNYNGITTGWTIQTDNKVYVNFSGDSSDISGTTILQPNIWYHVALSGSTGSYKLFLNGVQEGSTYTGATSLAGGILGIGALGDRPPYIGLVPVNGYISNLRIVNGRACYTSNFTPPTSPVTLLSNGGATPSTAPTSGQVSLLCDFTNGGIIDNTKTNVLTTVGDSKVSTSVVKYGTGSMAFDGSGDYLSNYTSQGAASTTFGTASFTVEMWVYFNTVAGNQGFCDASNQIGVSTTSGQFFFYKTATGLAFGNHNIGNLLTYNWTPIASVWYHVAVSRSGTSLKMFINGVEVASVINSTNFIGSGINIGVVATPYYLNGYIDDLRITKDIARYTSAFTPPTRAFPNVPVTASYSDPYFDDTVLLLHGDGFNLAQNNTFLDSSTNNFTITRSGSATQGSFSPYALNGVAYSPTIHGGSSYFSSGNLNKLTLPSTAVGSALDYGTGNFTIECWYNFIQIGINNLGFIISQTVPSNNNLLFAINSSRAINIWLGNVNLGTSAVNLIPLNTWCHVALVRNGTSVQVYVNGVSVLTRTSSASLGGGMLPCINGYGHASGYGNICYISNMRIVKGLAVYTSNFTPPTSPVTLTSNGGATPSTSPTSGQVSLLCDFTNGGIFDNTKKNVLTTVGDAKVSTSVVKYGTGSMYFDGTGDYLTVPSSNNLAFGTGDFTVECWYYPLDNTHAASTVLELGNHANSQSAAFLFSGLTPFMYSGAYYNPASNSVSLNQWNHVVWQRTSGIFKMFVNGIGSSTVSFTNNLTLPSQVSIGYAAGYNPGGTSYNVYGYIDDFRITKGIARYTSAFTPPTRAFPNK